MDPGTHSNDDDDHPIHGLGLAGHAMSYWHLMIHLWPFSGVWRLFRLPLTLCCQPSPGDGQQGQALRKYTTCWLKSEILRKHWFRFKDCWHSHRSNVHKPRCGSRFLNSQSLSSFAFVISIQSWFPGSHLGCAFVCNKLCWTLHPSQVLTQSDKKINLKTLVWLFSLCKISDRLVGYLMLITSKHSLKMISSKLLIRYQDCDPLASGL